MSIQKAKECIQHSIDVPFMDVQNMADIIAGYSYIYDNVIIQITIIHSEVGVSVHTISFSKFVGMLGEKYDLLKDIINSGCTEILVKNNRGVAYFRCSKECATMDEFKVFLERLKQITVF